MLTIYSIYDGSLLILQCKNEEKYITALLFYSCEHYFLNFYYINNFSLSLRSNASICSHKKNLFFYRNTAASFNNFAFKIQAHLTSFDCPFWIPPTFCFLHSLMLLYALLPSEDSYQAIVESFIFLCSLHCNCCVTS